MKDFEQTRAEIFRRSEERIKERKRNRRRALALCVPLCLAVLVCSALFLPSLLPPQNDTAPSGTNGITEMPQQELSPSLPDAEHPFVAFTVRQAGNDAVCTETESGAAVDAAFAQICAALLSQESYEELVGAFSTDSPAMRDGEALQPSSSAAAQTYLITLKTASGASRTFALCENTLSDTAHAAKAQLSEAQAAALKAALGLPS